MIPLFEVENRLQATLIIVRPAHFGLPDPDLPVLASQPIGVDSYPG